MSKHSCKTDPRLRANRRLAIELIEQQRAPKLPGGNEWQECHDTRTRPTAKRRSLDQWSVTASDSTKVRRRYNGQEQKEREGRFARARSLARPPEWSWQLFSMDRPFYPIAEIPKRGCVLIENEVLATRI